MFCVTTQKYNIPNLHLVLSQYYQIYILFIEFILWVHIIEIQFYSIQIFNIKYLAMWLNCMNSYIVNRTKAYHSNEKTVMIRLHP